LQGVRQTGLIDIDWGTRRSWGHGIIDFLKRIFALREGLIRETEIKAGQHSTVQQDAALNGHGSV